MAAVDLPQMYQSPLGVSIRRHRVHWPLPLLLLCWWTMPALALDSLAVGLGTSSRWTSSMESSQYVSVVADSIWMWQVQADANLSTGIRERGGSVLKSIDTEQGPALALLPGGEVLCDGDGNTAYDPDQTPGSTRTTPVVIDLGAVFRINHLRFFPRLDHANQRRFLQEFSILTSALAVQPDEYRSLMAFYAATPNADPVVDKRFTSREVRYIRLAPAVNRAWEVAEFEIYGDGTVPQGEYVSKVLGAKQGTPVWGQVRYEGGDIAGASVVVQTRTGPDREPLHYYRLTGKGDEVEKVSQAVYPGLKEEEQGPIRSNPLWSVWETVSEGAVRSPGLRQFLQFRVTTATPGAVLRRLVIEYTYPPLARDLVGELSPIAVAPGEEYEFTLSLAVQMKTTGAAKDQDTGFRQLQVLSDAQISQVERVLVDDQETPATTSLRPGGFTVNLWKRIAQNGTFIQLVFRAKVFHDRTRFEVRALDRRTTTSGVETVYQAGREGDADAVAEGSSLVVRLDKKGGVPLIGGVRPEPKIFTPNGDGANDEATLVYTLLKLIQPAPVALDIFDLRGQRVRRVYEGADLNGEYQRPWDGRDARGALVPPGLYLYELRVEGDTGEERRQGVVGVVY